MQVEFVDRENFHEHQPSAQQVVEGLLARTKVLMSLSLTSLASASRQRSRQEGPRIFNAVNPCGFDPSVIPLRRLRSCSKTRESVAGDTVHSAFQRALR